jgi:subtilisin family serine protease
MRLRTTLPLRAALLCLVLLMVAPLAAASAIGSPQPSEANTSPTTPGDVSAIHTPLKHNRATVTLITGDKVTVVRSASGVPNVIFDPAPGSKPTGFDVHRDGTHTYVVPNDVASLVPDVLDPALFDVTGLVEMGYDDRRADDLPLIVRRASGTRRIHSASPLEPVATLDSIRATAVELDKDDSDDFGDELAEIRRPRPLSTAAALGGVTKIWLDRKLEASELDGYLTQVRAPAAWNSGLDGAGLTVAVLDTGVDDGHPALAGQVDAHANFSNAATPDDGHGHGTHVASLVAGTGAGSDGARQGIAPAADLLSGKVLGNDGFGQESWVIAGMEWAVDGGADIVNLSVGGPPEETDGPVVQSLDNLTAQTGTLFVVAAGNRGGFGDSPFTIDTPGSAASALTVGAVTATDALALFSSQGPTLGDYRLKPDVAAPGVEILGARAGARDTDLYVPMSGTSQATPIVAGAAALLMQQHPGWTWKQIKTQIVATADPYQFQTSWSHGGGRLDLDQAAHQNVTADLPTLDFGYLRHPDDAPKSRTVTLTNEGDEPVSLVVTDQVSNGAGETAPDGALVASPDRLTVPAGGTATTTVTLDPELLEDGLWQGGMSFSSGGTTLLRLPFGVYDEPERYELEVQVLDRNGDPYDPATGAGDPNGDTTIPIFNADNGFFYRLFPDENGRASARVAPGSYSIFARIITPAGNGNRETFTIAGTPALDIHADTSYVIDARDARRLDPPTVKGQPTEPKDAVGITYARHTDDRRGYIEFGFFDPQEVVDGRVYITPTQPVHSGTFETTFRWRLLPTGEAKPKAPDAYELLFNEPRFSDPLSPTLSGSDVADLAQVDTTYRPVGAPGEYLKGIVYQTIETGIGFVYRTPQEVPGTTGALMTAAPDVLWGHCVYVPANAEVPMCDDLHSFPRHERVEVQFGAALRPEVFDARHSFFGNMFVQAGIGDGEHRGALDPSAVDSSRLTLFKDGELVGSVEATFGFFPVPNEAGRFRLEQEWTLRDDFARSREALTVWTFDSAPPTDPSQAFSTTPPFMMLDYDAEVDLLGRTEPRQPLRLDVHASHLSGGTAPEQIEAMELWWSVDGGESWTQSSTRRTGTTTFTSMVPGTALQSGRSVSLRVAATDAAGNRVDQTVLGIIPVR